LKTVDPKDPGVRIPLSPHFLDNHINITKTHLDQVGFYLGVNL